MSCNSSAQSEREQCIHRIDRSVHGWKKLSGSAIVGLAALCMAGGVARALPPGQGLIAHLSRIAPTIAIFLGQTPATIPQTLSYLNGNGVVETYFPGGSVTTAGNPFFDTTLTNNGRSCFTCHIPQGGWTISPPQIATQLFVSRGKSPLFQPIDSANCPDSPGATALGPKFLAARTLLFNRGDFRISINGPNPLGPQSGPTFTTFEGNNSSDPGDNEAAAMPQWILTVKSDPTGCENDSTYGLPSNMVSVYRRTMPSANVALLNPGARGPNVFNIMWDAREPSLENQFIDATEFHGQTTNPPTMQQQNEGAEFQAGTFAAQIFDFAAGDLTGADGSGATGGPQNLFESRLNLPAGGFFPPGSCFTPESLEGFDFCPGIFGIPDAFTDFTAFATPPGKTANQIAQRESIARGEAIFNTRSFTINDVAGLDDVLNGSISPEPPGGSNSMVTGTCSTCHNNFNAGNDSFLDPKREGIMDNSNNTNNALPPSSDFPLFAFYCPSGSIPFFSNQVTSKYCQDLPGSPSACDEFDTTDPGLGLADGECEDLGKMKVPVLHSLAARAPYFHGGNVANLTVLVNFYNTRFSIGLSAQDKTDLVNFLNTL